MKYILVSLTFIILALLLLHPAGEADTWWHIKTGQIMVEDMRVTQADEFSYTKAGEKWLNHSWLSDIFFYFIYKLSGIDGITIFSAVLIFFAFILLFINVRRRGGWLSAVFLTFLVILFSQDEFLPRPLALSLFLFSLFIFILHRYKYEPSSKTDNLPYVLVPLQVAWVNLHGASILGVFLIWAFIAGEFIDSRIREGFKNEFVIEGGRYKKLLFAGILLTISAGITPYGYNAVFCPVKEFSGMYFIDEWLPSVHNDIFLNFGIMPYYRLFLLISVFVFIFRGRRIASSHIIIFGSLLYLSLSGKRHLPFYGFAIAPCVAWYLKDIRFNAMASRLKKPVIYAISLALILYMAFLGKDILTGKYYIKKNMDCWVGLGTVGYPKKAMDFLEISGLEGRMFNDYSSGGFLIHRFYPDKKVYLDGRNTIYGVKFITENYLKCLIYPSLFEETARKYDINYVFIYYGLSNTAALIPYLHQSDNWQLVYFDDQVCIYAKNTEKNAGIIKKYRVDLTETRKEAGLERRGWQVIYPRGFINRAMFYESVGLVDMAIETLRGISVIAPYVNDAHYNLGTLYLKKGMYEDAVKEFKDAIKAGRMDAGAYNNLGVAYAKLARYKDAVKQFRKAFWLNPLQREARRNLKISASFDKI